VDVERAITELAVGEALVSCLDAKGAPRPVERTLVRPPASRIGTIGAEERAATIAASPLRGRYDRTVDRESAYELLAARARQASAREESPPARRPGGGRAGGGRRDTAGEAMLKSAARSLGTEIGRQLGGRVGARILRGVLGSLLGGGR